MLESLFDAALVRIRQVARKHSPALNAPRMAIDSPSLNPASSMAGICAAGFMRRNSAVRVFVPGAAGQNWKGTLLMRQGQTTARTGCDTGTPNIFSMMMPVSKQPFAARRQVGQGRAGTACAGSCSLRTDVISILVLAGVERRVVGARRERAVEEIVQNQAEHTMPASSPAVAMFLLLSLVLAVQVTCAVMLPCVSVSGSADARRLTRGRSVARGQGKGRMMSSGSVWQELIDFVVDLGWIKMSILTAAVSIGTIFGCFCTVFCFMRNPRIMELYLQRVKASLVLLFERVDCYFLMQGPPTQVLVASQMCSSATGSCASWHR